MADQEKGKTTQGSLNLTKNLFGAFYLLCTVRAVANLKTHMALGRTEAMLNF